jgi:hypothetical protein
MGARARLSPQLPGLEFLGVADEWPAYQCMEASSDERGSAIMVSCLIPSHRKGVPTAPVVHTCL